MGDMVTFKSNGNSAGGYLAAPEAGTGPGVIVLQEWWGLVPQLKGVCDRLAAEGFVALAPDLFHGEIAEHTEMDKAAHLMNTFPADRAARDMHGAVSYLLAHDATLGNAIGIVGFCMGGMLTMLLAAREGDRVAVAVPFYGYAAGEGEPDWSGLTAVVRGQMAEDDGFFPAPGGAELVQRLTSMGKDVAFTVYPGTQHAFANDANSIGTYDPVAAEAAWTACLAALRAHLPL